MAAAQRNSQTLPAAPTKSNNGGDPTLMLSSYTSNVPRIRFPTPPFPHLLPPSAAGFGGPHLLGDLYF